MVFWRTKKNPKDNEAERREEALLHRQSDPALEPPTEYDSEMDENTRHRLGKTEYEILEDLEETPVPRHTLSGDLKEAEDLSDHSEEGGWFSRLRSGLSKSSAKLGRSLSDILTKSKLDAADLEALEDALIEADLGPKTAQKIIERFSPERFESADAAEVKARLAAVMAEILAPAAKPLAIEKPENGGPFVVLVCGVNGAGKTTTIGKLAWQQIKGERRSVMIAAADTFRAAAVEQLESWAKRSGAGFFSKEIGADAAAVAYEAYQKAKAEGSDVLLIDTAGRLHNKKNLMEELQKIIRVLKKQDQNLPHAVMLVLDATTGQNAFAQVETFKEMVNVTGLAVTKLDGSAKGGVLVGLADRFGLPVYLIGVGEGVEDMQPFHAQEYAASLLGLSDGD